MRKKLCEEEFLVSNYGVNEWDWEPNRIPRHQVSGSLGNIFKVGDVLCVWGKLFSTSGGGGNDV